MATKNSVESDEVRLKKKIAAKLAEQGMTVGDAGLRTLRKRLKREQRRRRSLTIRKRRAAGGKAEPVSA